MPLVPAAVLVVATVMPVVTVFVTLELEPDGCVLPPPPDTSDK